MKIVQIMPAGGWCGRFKGSDGKKWSEPLVGWALYDDGSVHALFDQGNGIADEESGNSEVIELLETYHPDVAEEKD